MASFFLTAQFPLIPCTYRPPSCLPPTCSRVFTYISNALFLNYNQKGKIAELLQRIPDDISISVVTDGSRILGLGDLGIDGVGIPMGKLALYSACAGINPCNTLPVVLDVGTNNGEKLKDPLYLGLRQNRITAAEEKEFIAEFMEAASKRWPGIVIQFEDVSCEMTRLRCSAGVRLTPRSYVTNLLVTFASSQPSWLSTFLPTTVTDIQRSTMTSREPPLSHLLASSTLSQKAASLRKTIE